MAQRVMAALCVLSTSYLADGKWLEMGQRGGGTYGMLFGPHDMKQKKGI